MELTFPGLCFLKSSTPLKFDTDGHATYYQPAPGAVSSLDHALVLTNMQAGMLVLKSVKGAFIFDTISVLDNIKVPEIYDSSQDLRDKRILFIL